MMKSKKIKIECNADVNLFNTVYDSMGIEGDIKNLLSNEKKEIDGEVVVEFFREEMREWNCCKLIFRVSYNDEFKMFIYITPSILPNIICKEVNTKNKTALYTYSTETGKMMLESEEFNPRAMMS